MPERFWIFIYQLVDTHRLVIDRPAGSRHPNYPDLIYPLDYGFLQDTRSPDNAGIDVWRGTEHHPLLNGVFCTIDQLKSDMEIKIVLGCNPGEIETIYSFHNGFSMAAVWLPNPTL